MRKKRIIPILVLLLCIGSVFGQFTDTTLYDFRDGVIIGAGESADGTLKLSGTYSHNGTTYGMDMKLNAQIKIAVDGACTVRFLGSKHSSLSMSGATVGGESLDPAELPTKVATDLVDSYEFKYAGFADTLVFTATGVGSDVYLPKLEVFNSGINYDFRDGVIIGAGESADGTLKLLGTYSHNGSSYGMDMKSDAQIKISVSGSCTIKFLGSKHSSLSMSGATVGGTSLNPAELPTEVVNDLKDSYEFTYVGFADTIVFTATGAGSDVYLPLLQVMLYEPPVAYDLRDGVIIGAGQSVDGSLKLSGTYSHNGTSYGMDMKSGAEIKIAVQGSGIIRFLGSKHSSLSMSGATVGGTSLTPAEQSTTVVNDLVDYYEFTHSGDADTLVFTATGAGSDVYLPLIEVVPAEVPSTPWVEKSGSIIINNDTIYITAGVTVSDDAIVSLDKGTLESAGPESAVVRIDLGGNDLDSFTPEVTGDISSVTLVNDTIYVAYADSSAMPFGYTIKVLKTWVEKTGVITINGVDINVTAGATYDANAVVTVSEGTVMSATAVAAAIRIDLAGNSLDSYMASISGDISEVSLSNDTIYVAYADSTKEPYGYIIKVSDNSIIIEAEPGKTYAYNLADGSIMPQISYEDLRYNTFVSEDGILTINSNTADESLQFGYHDNSHGAVVFPGNSFNAIVSENAIVTFVTCQYGTEDAVFIVTDTTGAIQDTIKAGNKGVEPAGEGTSSFAYSGKTGVLTFTLFSASTTSGQTYIHALSVENAAVIEPSDGKTEVWDFGAEQLDTSDYKNNLTEAIINSWYPASVDVGSAGNTLPTSFSASVLSWIGGGNDRLRTSNTNLTRYDAQNSSATYTGRIYVNGAAAVGRYLSLALSEDDEVTIVALSQNGSGRMNFEYVADPDYQNDVADLGSDAAEYNFVAKQGGTYHIFDDQDKPSYFRIFRKDASYLTLAGAIDLTAAVDIPSNYAILFTNEAGKTWTATMNPDNYSMRLPIGYTYELSLENANGYIITSGSTLTLTETTTDFDVTIEKVELYTVSGSITGLGSEISKLQLVYNADPSAEKIYVPEPLLDSDLGTYSVQLEPNCEYTISPFGINDYYIPTNTITIGEADASADVAFSAKPIYGVAIIASGLDAEQLANLNLIFTNLNEEAYIYSFDDVEGIILRDGTYSVAFDSLDDYAVEMGLTSNLTVAGADVTKALVFSPVTNWSFDDKAIENGTPSYKGLFLTGNVYNEVAKGHLVGKEGGTIQIPVNAGDKLRITYYYSAEFSIDGGETITTSSGSTSAFEYVDYTYTGTTAGFVTITNGVATSYFTNIAIGGAVDYAPIVYVGVDKDYQTVNGALDAIAKMIRVDDERVIVMIDPGNYEEMLVVSVPNITLKNASSTPDIILANAGVDISDNAVRITSYYGHGYNYYSMENNQKWNAERLRVNKENGYLSYENAGSGTTNGSYWNATVVVAANGFEAEDIIFENSFNQYISEKEADDIVVMWESGSKGERPTTYGSTDVQYKSFVERAAAISVTSADKVVLNRCRVIGRQDSFYGADGARVVVYKGTMMGGTDYLFGGMTAVFYKSDLAMNTSADNNDVSYITAAYQSSGRGYLMYECDVTSATPGIETASEYISKPGYFGRPWKATTSEVVFYNTTIEATNFPGYDGVSLIKAEGWNSSLGGESELMYEYGTTEESGEDNEMSRAIWASYLTEPTLNDGTEITTFNFTKGTDDWDPLPGLIANDTIPDEEIDFVQSITMLDIKVYGAGNRIYLKDVKDNTEVNVYSINGTLVRSLNIQTETSFEMREGLWIVKVVSGNEYNTIKVVTY